MTTPDRSPVATAIFGASDGATSLLGVLAGLYVAGASTATILSMAGALAVASAVGMAGGERLSGSSWRSAGVMGAATLAGSVVPALAPALLGRPGYAVAAAAVGALGVVIAEVRHTQVGRLAAYAQTLGILAVASVLSVASALALGAVG